MSSKHLFFNEFKTASLSDTDADHAWQELKILLNERIEAGLAGKLSTKSVNDIVNEALAEAEK